LINAAMKGNFGTGHWCNSGSAEITWVCVPAICVIPAVPKLPG